jgi:glutamate/tyrosine decarboxylase-like PLP-dependent enzyme
VAAKLHDVAGRWLVDVLHLPVETGVAFVSGATVANASCLAAARDSLLADLGWDVQADGLFGAPPLSVVVGEKAHSTLSKSLGLVGLGRNRVTVVPADDQGRMRAELLPDLDGPVLICAQAGEVNSGAFDPFDQIADWLAERSGWLHVDGAFGLWAAASPRLRTLVQGVERADSWATDCHKWLNVPYDSGISIVRDAAAHHAAMTLGAAYYVETAGGERDPYNWVPESSRRARGFTVLAALRSLGRSGLVDLIERDCALTRRMAERLSAGRRVRILNDVVLNQALVRFDGPDGDADGSAGDARTRAVVQGVQRDGTCWLGGTVWAGRAAMRVSVSGWRTTEDDIDRSAAAILRVLGEVDAAGG